MTEYNRGVNAARGAITRALAGSDFRMMPWDQIRDLIRESSRNVKIPEPKPIRTRPGPPEKS